MTDIQQLQDMIKNGDSVVDQDGKKIGKINQLYLDDQTGAPEWITARPVFWEALTRSSLFKAPRSHRDN